ncbi:hypothetical protein ACK1LH_19685 [Metabacillus indicus]|uniref:DUF2613 domain-containing protein n=1 Tax=Metabacillus TaxID=2675233 RepID=UPI0019397508|nr:DUF2613 domain-containing protein [Metabacillus sp. cB07]
MKIELSLSIILILITILIVGKSIGFDHFTEMLVSIRATLYGTIAAVAGALLGFVITGLSVLLTANSTPQLDMLRKSKHYKTIFKVFFSTSRFLGLLLLFALVGLIFDKDTHPILVLTYLTCWGVIIVTFRILRCLWVLEKIVDLYIHKEF